MNHKITEEEKQIRKERVLYIYFKLKEKNPKISIERFIKKQGITSESTARRIITDAANWKQGEIDLFLAIYNPIKSDSEAIEEVLSIDTDKVSSEVAEEPVSDDKQEDKSTECGTEAAYTIYELAAKNQELQKELQKYKNDLNTVLDDRRKLECLLSDNANAIELNPNYDSLYKVLLAAYNQASNGKGKERHQLNDEEPFENQKICEIARRLSVDYNLGQAVKKIYESKRLTDGRDIAELYGAINYIAAAIIVKQENK